MNKLIIDSLAVLNMPVSFQKYTGKSNQYITFHEYLANGELYEDDEEVLTAHYIQVDIWSKTDYIEVVNKVKEALKKQGFKRIDEIDLYEDDTKLYHKGLRFYYLEERSVV